MFDYIPIFVIMLLSLSLFLLFKLSIIESMFISICSIIVLMLIFVFMFGLSISAYIICSLVILLFIISIIFWIRKRILIKETLQNLLSPALIAYLLAMIIYYLMIRDNHLYTWDDFSHWGLAVRTLLVFDGYNITPNILHPQTIGMPMFNAFIAVFGGIKDANMIMGMWAMYWACLLLPVSRMKWDKVKTIAVYSIIMYSVLIFMSHQPRPNLYCDSMLSVISGSLVSYFLVYDKNNKSSNYVILFGCIILPHIKNGSGVLFALLVLAACTFKYGLSKIKFNKKWLLINVLAIGVSTITVFMVKKQIGVGTFNKNNTWFNPLDGLVEIATSLLGIGLIIILFILIFAFIFTIIKRKIKIRNIILVCIIMILTMLTGLYLKTDNNMFILIKAFIKNIASLNIYGLALYKILGTITIGIIMLYYFAINDDYKVQYIRINIILFIEGLIYTLSLIISYSQFSYSEALSSACLDRYLLSFIGYGVFVILGIVICRRDVIEATKARIGTTLVVLFILLITIMPAPMTVFNYERDKVFAVTQGDSGHLTNLLQNYSLPTYTSRENFSLGPPKYKGDAWSVDLDKDELEEYIVQSGYTHIVVLEIDDYFVETYGELFRENTDIIVDQLYLIKKYENNKIEIYIELEQ